MNGKYSLLDAHNYYIDTMLVCQLCQKCADIQRYKDGLLSRYNNHLLTENLRRWMLHYSDTLCVLIMINFVWNPVDITSNMLLKSNAGG